MLTCCVMVVSNFEVGFFAFIFQVFPNIFLKLVFLSYITLLPPILKVYAIDDVLNLQSPPLQPSSLPGI